MHGLVVGIVAAGTDVDPAALKPSPLSAVVFAVLAIATVLLLLSMLRHLRRARANLGPAPAAQSPEGPTEAAGSAVGGTELDEGDPR